MKIVNAFLLLLLIIIITAIANFKANLYWLIGYLILYFIGNKNKKYKQIVLSSYCYLSLMGILAVFSYQVFCSSSFAPYNDDSFYYLNIKEILERGYAQNTTFYEYFIALILTPIALFDDVSHFHMLIINWFLGSLVIVECLKLAQNLFPQVNNKHLVIASLFILFNSNFINGSVHLYRDVLMCYFFLLSINYGMDKKLFLAILFAIMTGFIRGANGAFAIMLVFIFKYSNYINTFNKKKILILMLFSFVIFHSLDSSLGLSGYLRSFSGNQEKISLNDRIVTRRESFYDNAQGAGGVMGLLQSDNILIKSLVVPIYMISPLKVGKPYVVENYITEQSRSVIIGRFRIEFIWEFISVVFISIMLYSIFSGLYYMFVSKNNVIFLIAIVFFIMVASVAFISMQHRHKMMFILFYPTIYYAYINYTKNVFVNKNKLFVIVSVLTILIYNLI